MANRWQDDPDLVRAGDEDDLQRIDVEIRWQHLFEMMESIFAPGDGGFAAGAQRAFMKGLMWQAKKKVAADPDGARAYVIESMHAIAACLEVEPVELYPDLKPKAAAGVT